MAIDNMQQEVWAAGLLRALYAESVYTSAANRNYERDASNAHMVHISSITNSPTIRDYAKATALEAPETLDDADQVLNLDQQKYFNVKVQDIDAVQTRPDIMGEYLRKAAIAVAQVVDSFASGLLNTSVGAAIANAAAATSLRIRNVEVDATNDNETGKNLLNGMIEILELVEDANVSTTAGKFMFITPYWSRMIRKYFLENAEGLFVPATQEQIMQGLIGNFYGFEMRRTNRSPQHRTTDSIIVTTSDAWTMADQIAEIEGYRPENDFADAVKGLYVYGGRVLDPLQVWRIDKAV